MIILSPLLIFNFFHQACFLYVENFSLGRSYRDHILEVEGELEDGINNRNIVENEFIINRRDKKKKYIYR